MWSEEWDKKFREAAGQENRSANPETGWQQMQPLLEKHLPEDRRRKRMLILLFLFCAFGFAVYINTRSLQPQPQEDLSKEKPSRQATPGEKTVAMQRPPASTASDTRDKPVAISQSPALQPDVPFSINPNASNSGKPFRRGVQPDPKVLPAQETGSGNTFDFQGQTTQEPADRKDAVYNNYVVLLEFKPGAEHAPAEEKVPVPGLHSIDITTSHNVTTEPPLRKASPPRSKWGISLMGGADISSTGWNNSGSWRTAQGIGISYDINDRWTVRTGFISSRKVYGADSSDYNPPDIFWNYVSELKGVDANCLVYEIPLNAMYYFRSRGKSKWFASAGLHSFLMKKETYHYDFKDMAGQDRYTTRTYNNYSNHFFSVLQVSGGVQYPVTRKFKIGAEPYLKLPLGGVGYGNVRLYGAGMMFSATFNP